MDNRVDVRGRTVRATHWVRAALVYPAANHLRNIAHSVIPSIKRALPVADVNWIYDEESLPEVGVDVRQGFPLFMEQKTMRLRKTLAVTTASIMLTTGCSMFTNVQGHSQAKHNHATVTVRLVAPPVPTQLASFGGEVSSSLVADQAYNPFSTPSMSPFHAVVWGGPFDGQEFTHTPAPLTPGSYTFGVFDEEHDATYQGWITVNSSTDSLLNTLHDWRNTVREQKEWLGFNNKMVGNFSNPDEVSFKQYQKQLRGLTKLERRIERAMKEEVRAKARRQKQQLEFANNMEVLLIPGSSEFFTTSTQAAFSQPELANIRTGQAMTKVIMVADYSKAVEKLRRINNMRADLNGCRMILTEQINRLQRRKGLYTLTDNLYNHDQRFIQNETQLQQAQAMVNRINHLIADYRQQCHALMFVAGLFSPDDTFDAFRDEEQALQHDNVVLMEQKRQIDMRFDNTSPQSRNRVLIERQRQNIIAALESIENQTSEIAEARVALNQLRDSTDIIHRQENARIMTATIFDTGMPGPLADAIENEAMMTVRWHGTTSMNMPKRTNLTSFQDFGH